MTTDTPTGNDRAAMPLGYAMTPKRTRWWPPYALVGFALLAPLAVYVLGPSHRRIHEHPPRVYCASNLRQIGQGIQLYANEHGGLFPPDLATMLLTDDLTADACVCPATQDTRAEGATTQAVATNLTAGGHLSYVYTGKGLTGGAPRNAVLAYEPLGNHGAGLNVLFADGSVQWLDATQGQRLIAELAAGHNPPRGFQPAGGGDK